MGSGSLVPPVHRYYNDDGYTKQSHELRISSPQDKRVRGLLGFFWQEQKHDFWQPFLVEGLADIMLPNQGANPLFADIVYLNSMDRKDTDEAVFASVSFDITEQLELTGGIRFFKAETTVNGFFGFGLGFNPGTRPSPTQRPPDEPGAPRTAAKAPSWTLGSRLVAQRRVALPVAGGRRGQTVHRTSTARSRATTTSAAST